MNGMLLIKVDGTKIHVKGSLKDASLAGQVAIVDALMNTFEMTGSLREEVCDFLVLVDEQRSKEPKESKESKRDIEDLLDELFSKLQEES